MDLFEIAGALGLLLISVGVVLKNRKEEDILYIAGGILLEIYSISIHSTIFIILQIVFTASATYDFLKKRRSRKSDH